MVGQTSNHTPPKPTTADKPSNESPERFPHARQLISKPGDELMANGTNHPCATSNPIQLSRNSTLTLSHRSTDTMLRDYLARAVSIGLHPPPLSKATKIATPSAFQLLTTRPNTNCQYAVFDPTDHPLVPSPLHGHAWKSLLAGYDEKDTILGCIAHGVKLGYKGRFEHEGRRGGLNLKMNAVDRSLWERRLRKE
jgi:hypothetical protein